MVKLCHPLIVLNQLHFIQGCESLMKTTEIAKGAGIIPVLAWEGPGLMGNWKDQRK